MAFRVGSLRSGGGCFGFAFPEGVWALRKRAPGSPGAAVVPAGGLVTVRGETMAAAVREAQATGHTGSCVQNTDTFTPGSKTSEVPALVYYGGGGSCSCVPLPPLCTAPGAHRRGEGRAFGGAGIWRWLEACCAHGGLWGRVSPPQVVLSLGDLCGDSSHSIPEKSSISARYQFSVVA